MRCPRIETLHLDTELLLDVQHVLVVLLREHPNINTHQLLVGAATVAVSAGLVDGINDMGVVVAKTEAQGYQ